MESKDAATEQSAAEKPVDATPEQVALDPRIATALRAAAKALGVPEATPDADLPGAIEAAQVKAQETAQTADAQAQDTALQAQVADKLFKDYGAPLIMEQMRREFGDNVEAKEWWKNDTWDADGHGDAMLARFNALRDQAAKTPEMEALFQSTFAAEKARISDFAAAHPNAVRDVVPVLRQNGFPEAVIADIAKRTESAVSYATDGLNRQISTLHSDSVAKDAELTTLRNEVSGHAAALAKAREEGRGRRAKRRTRCCQIRSRDSGYQRGRLGHA